MKITVILLMLVIASFTLSAQDSTKYVTNTDAEKLIDKYSAKIETAIVSLADKLQQPAEHVYKILIKQRIVYGLSTVLAVVIFAFLFVFCYYKNMSDDASYNEELAYAIGMVFFAIGFVISLIFLFDSGLTSLINPEYGAMMDIVKMIR